MVEGLLETLTPHIDWPRVVDEQFQGLVHMGSQVLNPNYDMDAYMATLSGGEAQYLYCELGRATS
jgi:hypothetical protein